MDKNIILNADSYKASHYSQYPDNTQYISCYIEYRDKTIQEAIFFGLQAFLKEYISKPIVSSDIKEAEDFLQAHGLPFNKPAWEYILQKHGGFLPLEIEAPLEGTSIPSRNVMLQVINTDPICFWLPCYVETAILRAIWYPVSVATLSFNCKKVITRFLLETSGSAESADWKLQDFGARGASSYETAAIGGMGHLLSFQGSSNMPAILAARRYYGESMAGYAIPAAEHSTIITWSPDNESTAYRHILDTFRKSHNIVAIVSDSYNLWNALDSIWGDELREHVMNSGGTLVIRLDSGKPIEVVPKSIEILMEKFGYTTNPIGYKVLPSYLRVLQGDGVDLKGIEAILQAMKERGQSAENIAFGMGGALLQKLNRDTMQFAMKPSSVCIDNHLYGVAKTPFTDINKHSKKGRLALVKSYNDDVQTVQLAELHNRENLLKPVFRNGQLLNEQTFVEIRSRIK